MDNYEPHAIERKWQQVWDEAGAFVTANPEGADTRKKAYVLEMLPYPSGELHMGHVLNYTLGDVVSHVRRRHGFAVLRPMGYDAFGLPAENAAIREGGHPREVTDRNIAAIRAQIKRMGWSIDWSREVSTHEPEYYRWTQWLFLKLYGKGLAYRKAAPVKWCPFDQTVLANEQVIDGHCERCGHEVESRNLEQWMFKITDFADRLLDDMAQLEWPERVLTMQRNWIGRSVGAEVTFRVEELDENVPVFTTRPDTLFGATFFVLAPEHPLVEKFAERSPDGAGAARVRTARRREEERGARGLGRQDRRLHGVLRREPRQRRAHTDLGCRLRPDGLRHRRDHGRAGARRARLRLRREVRPAGRPGRGARLGRGHRGRGLRLALRRRGDRELGRVLGPVVARGEDGDRRVARVARPRPRRSQLPAPRLAALAPALLGLPHPDDPLRGLRARSGARVGAAGDPARGGRLRAEGPVTAGRGRGLGERQLPVVRRARRSARRTRWTRSSTRPGTSCATPTR